MEKIRETLRTTAFCQRFVQEFIHEGDTCIDATCGRGGDTVFLCRAVGAAGRVAAFDIQQEALDATRQRLCRAGLEDRVCLIRRGHEHMQEAMAEVMPGAAGHVAAAMFNFGYLPGGDHAVHTEPATSLEAVKQCRELLRPGGVMSLCIYSGGDSGYAEREALLAALKVMDPARWLVIRADYYNRGSDPPLPVFIVRLSA